MARDVGERSDVPSQSEPNPMASNLYGSCAPDVSDPNGPPVECAGTSYQDVVIVPLARGMPCDRSPDVTSCNYTVVADASYEQCQCLPTCNGSRAVWHCVRWISGPDAPPELNA